MRNPRALFLRLAWLFDKMSHQRDLDAEIESHLQLQMEDNVSAGTNPVQARREALINLGDIEQTKEAYRIEKVCRCSKYFFRIFILPHV